MEKLGQDKMMHGTEKGVDQKTAYFFPDHGVTVQASSTEEAESELAKTKIEVAPAKEDATLPTEETK